MTKTAILFPGQGSQEKGMGRDVAEARSEALDLWKLAENESGQPLREIYWEGEDRDMSETSALQPALTVVNLALFSALGSKIEPVAAAGHSLGEFAALAAAGVLSVKDAVKATAIRGRLMSEAGGPGQGMAAVVKLEQGVVEDIVSEAAGLGQLRVANYNSPAQFVISGENKALERAAELVKEQKGRAIPLAVSGAFHSPLIQEAADEFAAYLKKLDWREPAFPVFFNATALPEGDSGKIREIMCRQMTSSVLWIQTIENQWQAGVRSWLELGPKGVLTKLLKANLKDREYEGVNISTLEQGGEL